MPLVARDMLQGLAHAPLGNFWADNILTVGNFTNVAPTGAGGVVFASYTVPAGKLARITGISLCIEKATVFSQLKIVGYVNGTRFFAHLSTVESDLNLLSGFHRILKPGDLLELRWTNTEAGNKSMGCFLSVEEIDI